MIEISCIRMQGRCDYGTIVYLFMYEKLCSGDDETTKPESKHALIRCMYRNKAVAKTDGDTDARLNGRKGLGLRTPSEAKCDEKNHVKECTNAC